MPNKTPPSGPVESNSAASFAAAGVLALQQNDYTAAIEHLSRAAQADPSCSAHFNNLGLALEGAGRFDEARRAFEQAVDVAPHSPIAHYNLGGVCFALGDLSSAANAFRTAIALDPQNAAACNNLGLVLANLNRREQAVAQFQAALQQRPDYAAAFSNLGQTLLEMGQLDAAEQSLRRAVELAPGLAAAHNNLGLVLFEKGDAEAAMESYRAATALDPHGGDAYDNWGVALRETGRLSEAIACHERAISINPGLASAAHNLAVAQAQLGRFDEAAAGFRRALSIDRKFTAAYVQLAQLREAPLTDDDVVQLETLENDPLLRSQEQSLAAFALGLVFDRCGDFERAFVHFDRANRLAERTYDPHDHDRFIERIIDVFNIGLLSNPPAPGSDDARPVFIVGMPRSGTTLVEQIITSHPAAAAGGELLPLSRIARSLAAPGVESSEFPESVKLLDNASVARAISSYLDRVNEIGVDALRVTDKLPGNYQYLGLAALLFPQARVIHCRRHPLDTCLSCYFQNFDQSSFAFDLAHLARRYKAYRRLMEHWRSVLPLSIYEVDYEKLVSDPAAATRQLIAACGLPWDDRCLRPEVNPRAIDTASLWQARQPIYRGSVGKWRRYEKQLAPLIAALGDDAKTS